MTMCHRSSLVLSTLYSQQRLHIFVSVSVRFAFEPPLFLFCFFLNRCFSCPLLVCPVFVIFLAPCDFARGRKAHHTDSEHRWCSHGRGFMQWGTMCLIVSPVWDVLIPGAATNRCLVRVDVPLKFLSCLSWEVHRSVVAATVPACACGGILMWHYLCARGTWQVYPYVSGAVRLGSPSLSLQKSPWVLVFASASSR